MAELAPSIFSKVVLLKDVEHESLLGSTVELEIDLSYTIGKSIAVLREGNILGHLDRSVSRVVWRHLRNQSNLEANIYSRIGGWKNEPWYSVLTHSFEIGIKITFLDKSREDAKLLLAHVAWRKLNSFPGVSLLNCPTELESLVRPIKDENGISSLLFSSNVVLDE